MSDPGSAPALDAEDGDDRSYYIKTNKRKLENGEIRNIIKIAKKPKMTDHRAEVALDAEHGDLVVELLEWLAEKHRRQELPPHLVQFFNHGSLPEEKKVTKTPVKKRAYKPKHNPQIEALNKEKIKFHTKYLEANKKLQNAMSMERVKKILDRIEKDKNMLEKVVASMKNKNIQIDKNDKERLATISREIDKIKNNVNEINKNKDSTKDSMERELKKWKEMEVRAKTEMAVMKRRQQARKQEEAEEKERIDHEIQNTKDTWAKEEKNIQSNIEAKKKTLAMVKDQCNKNIQKKKEEEARINAALKKSKYDELKVKEKMDQIDRDIAAKRTEVAEIEKEIEKKIKEIKETKQEKITYFDREIKKIKDDEVVEKRKMEKDYEIWLKSKQQQLHMAIEESETRIRDMQLHLAERERSIDDEIKHFEEEVAHRIQFLIFYEEHIQINQADKQSQFEAEMQKLKEREDQAKINLENNIQSWQNSLTNNKDQVERSIKEKQREEAAVKNEIKNKIRDMNENEARKIMEIEKSITDMKKKFEEDEDKSGDRIAMKQQEKQAIIIQKNIEAMQKRENEKHEEIGAKIKIKFK